MLAHNMETKENSLWDAQKFVIVSPRAQVPQAPDYITKLLTSGVARGGGLGGSTPPPIRIEAVFFHSRKVTVIKYLTFL